MKAILRFAPVFDARMINDPKLGREVMVQRGAFTTMKWTGEIPVVVDHDLGRVVGEVTHLRTDEYAPGGGDWWAAHADITDPPGWLQKGDGVSWSCYTLQAQNVNGTRRILKGILEEISLLSPSKKPADGSARVTWLDESSSPAVGTSGRAAGEVFYGGKTITRHGIGQVLGVR